jgi:hypothetical protein
MSEGKPKYEPPLVVEMSELARVVGGAGGECGAGETGGGACKNGGSPTGTCNLGFSKGDQGGSVTPP